MSRFFLSGQTTCALLLGAGLLLRAQAALRPEPEQQGTAAQSVEAPGTRNSDMVQDLHSPRAVWISHAAETTPAPKIVRVEQAPQVQTEKIVAQSGKVSARGQHHSKRRCSVAVAARGFRCG